jgi:hypothetical protein
LQGFTGNFVFRFKIGHLAKGMDPGVRPAGADQIYIRLGDLGNLFPHHSLDGPKPRLYLPAVVCIPIVLNN